MKITEVTYRQVLQIKNFEPADITVTAVVNDGEDPAEAMDKVKTFVQDELKKVYFKANPDKAPKPVPPIAAPLQNTDQPKPGTKKVAATPQQKIDTDEEMPDLN